ncbi:hypothetical protein L1887_33436 [Cichorium endivia]|nr:hypothetical protein L1887_33436 [Cichorium endivia]
MTNRETTAIALKRPKRPKKPRVLRACGGFTWPLPPWSRRPFRSRGGCFVLFFIECLANWNKILFLNNEYLGAMGFANITRDIFLLENQISFVVLQVLLDLRFPAKSGDDEEILNKFFNYLNYGEITKSEEKVFDYKKQPLHLLELYRSYFISLSCSGIGSNNSSKWKIWRKKIDVVDDEDWHYVKRNRSFASVTELKAKGIFVRPTNDDTSNKYMPCNPHVYGLCNFTSVSHDSRLYVLGGSLFDTRSFPLDPYSVINYETRA